MDATDAALVQSENGSKTPLSQSSCLSGPCALWIVELKLRHLDWNPEATLILFQGQHLSICELEYSILQNEIQNIPKKNAAVEIGEFCLVEDMTSCHWYRGRVQNRTENLFDVFLIDHGNVLSVDIAHISSCSNDLFILPPKIVCGFLSNILLPRGCSSSGVEDYFSSLIGSNITGHIQALLPDKVHLLEAPDINNDLVKHGFGRHVDTDTFLLLLEMLAEVPLKQNIDAVPDLLIVRPRRPEFNFEPSGLGVYKKMLALSGPRLSCGSTANVRVTAAVNPGLFYCQMTNVEEDLWKMSKKLADVSESRTKDHSQQTPENLGLLCSVKGKEGKWCRGFVQSLPVNSQVRVLFIDYGFFESVKVENIHKLPPELYSTPIMAFRCSLSSLSGQEKAVKNQQLSFLKAGLLGGFLDVEIGHFDEEEQTYSITVITAQENVKKPERIQRSHNIKLKPVLGTEGSSVDRGFLNCDKIMDQAFAKTLEEEVVHVGSVFVGYVEYVESPHNFWIRTQERNTEFEEMLTKMEAHFRHVKLDEDVLMNPQPGMLCCAVYEEDMHFYRGIVTDTLEYGAEILFIDFGNVQKVPYKLIKRMPDGIADKSAFALRCSLVNVIPFDDVWSTMKTDFFRQAVSNRALLIHIVQMKKNKFVVDLCEMGNTKIHSITELLVSSKQAEFLNNRLMEPVEQNEDLENNQQEETGKNAKSRVPISFKALSLQPGCELAVKCSSITSTSDFWCQPQNKLPALEEMMSEIQQYYSAHRVPLQYGDVCCVARSPQDGRWYRAVIKEWENGQAKVILVDYGFTVQIKENCLQRIMPQYVDLEGHAFRCSLFNLIEPVENESSEDWSHEIFDALKESSHDSNGHMRCKVFSQLNMKDKELYHVVDLYNTRTQRSTTNMLVEHSLARTFSPKQASVAFPESFVYSSFDLSLKSEEQVFVTHINSQWEIYCHLKRNSEVIDRLEEEISEKSEKMKKASTKGVSRNLCLARYFDGKWYRGLVSPVASPLHLNVSFVDYGNMDICEKSRVMFIPRDSDHLLYTPMQALRLTLASVSKEDLYIDVQEWLQGAILNKQVRAVVVGMSEDGSFDVEMFDGDININEKVKELISSLSPKPRAVVTIKRECVKKTSSVMNKTCDSPPKSQGPNLHNSNNHSGTQARGQPCRKGYSIKSCREGTAQRKSNHMRSKPEQLALKNHNTTKLKKSSQVRRTRTLRVAKTEPLGHDKETANPQLFCLPGLKVREGHKSECFVSHINSVSSFFLQLSEEHSANLKMSENLNSSASRESLKPASNLKIDDLVLAEYEEDAALYRAVVRDHEGASCYRVEFLDFGNDAVLGKEKIYSLPKEYLIHARLSISCTLLETSIYDSVDTFTDAVMEKPLMVHFIRQSGGHWEVEMEVLDAGDGLPVTTEPKFEAAAIKKEPESSLTLPEMEEEVEFTEQASLQVESREERIESQQTIERENLQLAPPIVRPLTPPPTETPKETTGALFSEEIPLQHLTFAPIEIDKAYFGYAAAVTTPFEFCVVLEDSFLIMNSVSAVLDDLAGELPPLPEGHLKPGTCCMLKSDTKNKWCRTEILSANTTVTLKMVDYGHCESFPRGEGFNLKRLPEELIELPKVAYPCTLKGVKPVGLCWNNEAAVFFQECLYQKDLQIFFREPELSTYWEVDILAEGVQVAVKLVDAGHAVFTDNASDSSFLELHPSETLHRGLVTKEDHDQEDEDSSESWYLTSEDGDDTVETMPVIDEQESYQCLLM